MKEYVKPDLYYENFEMSQHVATCFWDMGNSTSRDSCSAKVPSGLGYPEDMALFNGGNSKCSLPAGSGEAYCWTNGSGNENVFNS